MKRRKRIMALLAAVCLLAAIIPLTGVTAGEMKSVTLQVLCNEKVLEGATITATFKGNNGENVIGSSANGELTLSSDLSEMEGKRIQVSITLPEGYEFPFQSDHPREETVGFEPGELFSHETLSWTAARASGEEGLFLTQNYFELSIGDSLDTSSSLDPNGESGNTDLYFQSKDGVKTRVGCTTMSIRNPECCVMDNDKPGMLHMVKAGTIQIAFYYGGYAAELTVVVKGDTSDPSDTPSDNSGQSYDIFRHSILHNGQVLEDAEITIRLENEDGTDSIVFATSNTGVIEVSRSSAELKNYEWFCIEMKLPEGYQFLTLGNMQNETTIGYEMKTILDQNLFLGDETCEVVNPAIDGSLEVSKDRIEAEMGDVIDISGAFDLNAEDIQLYYTAPNGVRTRVVCDDYSIIQENRVQKEGYKLKVVEYGLTEIIFFYKNAMAKFEILAPNPDFPSETIQISDNEYIYIYPDGTEKRVLFTEDGINGTYLEGNKDYIPAGGRFESRPVTAGEAFDKAKDRVKKNFNTEDFWVFEMNLWDAAGRAVHQLPGMVEVKMELPEGYKAAEGKTIMVYRLESNGNLARCSTAQEDGWVSFSTDHFSTYILAQVGQNIVEPSQNVSASAATSGDATAAADGAAVSAPKTGEGFPMPYIGIALASIALVAVNWKKGQKETV